MNKNYQNPSLNQQNASQAPVSDPHLTTLNQASILRNEENNHILQGSLNQSSIASNSMRNTFNKINISFSFNNPKRQNSLKDTLAVKITNTNKEKNINSKDSYKLLIKRIAMQLKKKVRQPTHGFFFFAMLKGSYPLIIIKKIETQIINHSIDLNSDIFRVYSEKYVKYKELVKKIALLLKQNMKNKMFWENEKYNQVNSINNNQSIQVKVTEKNKPQVHNNQNQKKNNIKSNLHIQNKKIDTSKNIKITQNKKGNNANRIENPLIKNCEIKSNNGNINELSNSEMNHYNMIYVNKNNFMNCMNNESILGYILAQNKKINGYKILFLNNINIILTYLKTYKGSIIIQELFDKVNDNELATLFYNLIPHIPYIMCLEYGNYFFQKFIKKLNLKQRLAIYEIIEPNFIEIATNKSGTHSIQSLIECISSPVEIVILDKLLSKNRLLLFLNEHAYHIVMKIILDIDEDKRNNLNLFLVSNVEKIIINYNGAFCVNKFIHKNKNLQLRYLLVQNLNNNIHNLISNKYSCTILLLILEQFGVNTGLFIVKYIQNNLSILSLSYITVVFIIKTLKFLYKYNSFELGILIWYVYKNDKLINYLLSHENGKELLKEMINLSDEEQKKYICMKLCSKKIKEN